MRMMEVVSPSLDIGRLVDEHHAAVYRYAYRLTGVAADAEDLTQQTFLQAQENLAQLRDPQRACPWLLAITRNGYLRERRRHLPVAECDAPLELADFAESPLPGSRLDDWPDEFDPERLQQALNHLPDEFKLVVLGYYFEERSYREIADDLQVPIGTVMSRLSRAKSQLRRAMELAASTESYR